MSAVKGERVRVHECGLCIIDSALEDQLFAAGAANFEVIDSMLGADRG